MKIKFKEFLKEYRKAPLGQSFDKVELRNFLSDEDNLELLRTHLVIPGEKDVVIFEYSFDAKHKVFILTDRKSRDDIVGYMFIHQLLPDIWQVTDVTIYSPYQNKGLGVDLYVKVIQSKFDLVNGYSLSDQAMSVWKKLKSFVNLRVINIKTQKIEKLSDKPEQDVTSDDKQEWFFLATSKHELPEGLLENAGVSCSSDIMYERWLVADPSYKMHGFRSSKFGDLGDF